MILLREIQEKDLDALERFAQIPGFINLTADRDALREKILRAQASFSDALKDKNDGKFIFVAESVAADGARQVVGTSMIATQHGTVDSPHFYFEVGNEEKFSDTINTGFIHGTLTLKYDTNGPSEIGGLVLDPQYRNNSDERLGRQISFVRFLYLGMNRSKFKKKILAELLPPLNKKGQSPLWEAIGRRFTNMDYWEADTLCQRNKEFIFSLFPSGKIYTTFFPAEARNAIGKVGKDTEPVLHMLKKIGFKYKNQVDPFDGGPHLWCDVEDMLPVKKQATLRYQPAIAADSSLIQESGLICRAKAKPGEFRAMAIHAVRGKAGSPEADAVAVYGMPDAERAGLEKELGLVPGEPAVFMPYY